MKNVIIVPRVVPYRAMSCHNEEGEIFGSGRSSREGEILLMQAILWM